MAEVLKFVTSITSPTTRLDLNDGVTWKVLLGGTSFHPPELKKNRVGSYLTNGEKITASSFSNRFCVLSLELNATAGDSIATAVHNLLVEVMRERNVLMWQPHGATSPVYYHTYQASPRVIDDILRAKKRIVIELEASPFAYGGRVSLGNFTVDADPAGSTNPTYVSLSSSAVPGDVPTPLFMKVTASDAIKSGRATMAVAIRAGGTPTAAPQFFQAESMSLASNTATQANSSAWSGSSSNRVRASSLTTSFVVRSTLSSLYPATPSVDVAGTYRVWLRGAQTVGTDEIRGRLEWSGDGTNWVAGSEEIFPANGSTVTRWWDLGLVQFPIGRLPRTDGLSGASVAVSGLRFRLALTRTFGSGNFDYDVFKFMPADQSTLYVEFPGTSGPTDFIVDGFAPSAYGRDSSGNVVSTEIIGLHGGPPMLHPNVANLVHIIPDVGGTATAGSALPSTLATELYCWPAFIRERTA